KNKNKCCGNRLKVESVRHGARLIAFQKNSLKRRGKNCGGAREVSARLPRLNIRSGSSGTARVRVVWIGCATKRVLLLRGRSLALSRQFLTRRCAGLKKLSNQFSRKRMKTGSSF